MDFVKNIVNLVFWLLEIVIGGGGVLWGAYQLWESFTADQPENKKKGVQVLLVTGAVLAVLIPFHVILNNMLATPPTV